MNTEFYDSPEIDVYKVYTDDCHHYEIVYSVSIDKWFITEHTTFQADEFGRNMRTVNNSVGYR